MAVSRNDTLVDDAPYQQGLLAEPFYEHGPFPGPTNTVVMTVNKTDTSQVIKTPLNLTPISENLPAFSMELVCLQNGALTSIALTETTRLLTRR